MRKRQFMSQPNICQLHYLKMHALSFPLRLLHLLTQLQHMHQRHLLLSLKLLFWQFLSFWHCSRYQFLNRAQPMRFLHVSLPELRSHEHQLQQL